MLAPAPGLAIRYVGTGSNIGFNIQPRAGVAAPAAEALRRLAACSPRGKPSGKPACGPSGEPGGTPSDGLAALTLADLEADAVRFAERVARVHRR